MSDIEQAVAEALDRGVHVDDAARAARIAVTTLAGVGDITDDDIKEALLRNDRPLGAVLSLLTYNESVDLIATVRALLDQQRAVDAARIVRSHKGAE